MTPVYGALDLASATGVATGEAFKRPTCETWNVKGDLGERGALLWERLHDWLDRYPSMQLVFIEAPLDAHIAAKMGTEQNTTIALNGYVFLAASVCKVRNVPWEMYKRQDVLKHFTGQPRWKEKDAGKRACETRCRALGWPTENWNEADACALLDYGCSIALRQDYIKAAINRPKTF